jgi:hypothetical protein
VKIKPKHEMRNIVFDHGLNCFSAGGGQKSNPIRRLASNHDFKSSPRGSTQISKGSAPGNGIRSTYRDWRGSTNRGGLTCCPARRVPHETQAVTSQPGERPKSIRTKPMGKTLQQPNEQGLECGDRQSAHEKSKPISLSGSPGEAANEFDCGDTNFSSHPVTSRYGLCDRVWSHDVVERHGHGSRPFRQVGGALWAYDLSRLRGMPI